MGENGLRYTNSNSSGLPSNQEESGLVPHQEESGNKEFKLSKVSTGVKEMIEGVQTSNFLLNQKIGEFNKVRDIALENIKPFRERLYKEKNDIDNNSKLGKEKKDELKKQSQVRFQEEVNKILPKHNRLIKEIYDLLKVKNPERVYYKNGVYAKLPGPGANKVETTQDNTSNSLVTGNIEVRNPSDEKSYIMPREKFIRLYGEEALNNLTFTESSEPIKPIKEDARNGVIVDRDIDIIATWGESFTLKKGGVLVIEENNGLINGSYGIQPQSLPDYETR